MRPAIVQRSQWLRGHGQTHSKACLVQQAWPVAAESQASGVSNGTLLRFLKLVAAIQTSPLALADQAKSKGLRSWPVA